MQTRAAVAFKAEAPLTIETVDMEGKINIDELIPHTMRLDEMNTAFDLMHEGKSIRSVVVF